MSTNHTPNYALSQWQASDQVLRTDFNEDNVKIDTALKNRLRPKIITTLTFGEDQYTAQMDLTGVNWDEWLIAGLVYYETRNNPPSLSFSGYDKDGITIPVHSNTGNWGGLYAGGVGGTIFFPFYNKKKKVTFFLASSPSSGTACSFGFADIPFGELAGLNFYCPSCLAPNVTFTLWGLK